MPLAQRARPLDHDAYQETPRVCQEHPTGAGIAMGTRRRLDRAAAVVLAVAGVALLATSLVAFAQALPAMRGTEGEHMAGDATLWVMVIAVPMTVGGLATLLAASMLWRGSPMAGTVALAWVALAGLVCVFLTTSPGNILYAARVVLLESGTWSLEGPMLGVQSASFTEGATYYGHLDKVTFWIPWIVAVGAILVACLVLAGWVADVVRGARSG